MLIFIFFLSLYFNTQTCNYIIMHKSLLSIVTYNLIIVFWGNLVQKYCKYCDFKLDKRSNLTVKTKKNIINNYLQQVLL
jgi:hypothetical protein